MIEPSGSGVEGTPWEEPRPPHLPDRLTRVPWLAWPFVLVAIVLAWPAFSAISGAFLRGQGGPAWSVLIDQLAPMAAALIGTALFLRHPDAHRTLPRVAIGAGLLALREVLRLLAGPLEPFFASLTPAPEAFPFLVPLAAAFDAFVSLVGIFGLLYLVRGLDEARRHDDPGRSRRAIAGVLVLVAVLGAFRFLSLGPLPEDRSQIVGILVAVSMVVSTLVLLSWASLALVAGRGWRAGERPARGWSLAALAGALVLVSAVVTTVVERSAALAQVTLSPDDASLTLFSAVASLGDVAWIVLFAAVLVGLPSSEPAGDVELDAEDVSATPDRPATTPPGSARS